MKLSEWGTSGVGGIGYARTTVAEAVKDIFPDENPEAFVTLDDPHETLAPISVTLRAAFDAGLATARYTKNRRQDDPALTVLVIPWTQVTNLRLSLEGDPDDSPELVLSADGLDPITARRSEREALAEFFRAVAAKVR